LTGARRDRLPHHVSVVVSEVKGESLLAALDVAGISASSGAACAARAPEPSHVLRALGLEPRLAQGALGVTMGRWTTGEDVDAVLTELPPIVERLRAASPSGP